MKKISNFDNQMDKMLSESIRLESTDPNIKREAMVASNTYFKFLLDLYKKKLLDASQYAKAHDSFRKVVKNLNKDLGL